MWEYLPDYKMGCSIKLLTVLKKKTSHQIGTAFHCQGGRVDNVRHKF